MSWYRAGSVNVTQGSANVVGTDTLWSTQTKAGDIFKGPDDRLYEISSVTDDTHLAIKRLSGAASYEGASNAAGSYAIIRAEFFGGATNADLASRLAALMTKWHGREDEFIDWHNGAADGGPNEDGTYPMTNPATGVVTYVKCPARLEYENGIATTTHAALVGSAVHGLGSASVQDASETPAPGKIPLARSDGTLYPGWLPVSDMDYVGIAYDTATDTFTRRGSAQGLAVGSFPGTFISPLFQNLRRVVLADDGSVYKGISWTDFTKHDDGTDVARDGDNGQIMVEYLPGYYRAQVIGTTYILDLSHLPLPGFSIFPLFDGFSAVYLGAYEASVYDGKLCSIAIDPSDGTSPVWPVTTRDGDWGHSALTAAAIDTLAEARGSGWQQADFMTRNWERILMLVAFAGYNFQSIVGNGRTVLSDGDWINDSYIGRCGIGDAAGGYYSAVQVGGTAGYLTDYVQVLGVENTYGNIWDRVASLVSDFDVYYKLQPPYDYSATTNWTRLTDALGDGITLPDTNGHSGIPHSGLGLVLPADVTGSSSTRMADYFYQAAGLRVLLVGGLAASGTRAGPFAWHAGHAASSAAAIIGGRLCFKKT